MAYIYKIVNDINNKIYVGKTLHSIDKRFREHCRDSKKEKNEKRPLYLAMNKYGIEHFHIFLLEETDNPEEREKFWIEKLQSFKYGYNATIGGDGARYADYNLIYSLYKEGKTYKEISNITKYGEQTIRKALSEKGISKQERNIQGHKHLLKAVAKLDPKTEEILEVYSSISEAERANGNTKHISSVCQGKRKTCQGFKWKYI